MNGEDKMKGYKGFNPGLICHGKHYTENTVFEEIEEHAKIYGGMHFCANPFDVLNYYPLVNEDGSFRFPSPCGDELIQQNQPIFCAY